MVGVFFTNHILLLPLYTPFSPLLTPYSLLPTPNSPLNTNHYYFLCMTSACGSLDLPVFPVANPAILSGDFPLQSGMVVTRSTVSAIPRLSYRPVPYLSESIARHLPKHFHPASPNSSLHLFTNFLLNASFSVISLTRYTPDE